MKYFTLDEFKCPCCGQVNMNEDFLEMLDKARDLAGVPFVITSGYRCQKHNAKVGGKPNSAHLRGLASDIRIVNSKTRYVIVKSLLDVGFKRLGIGKDFVHVDMDMSLPHPRIWTYYAKD